MIDNPISMTCPACHGRAFDTDALPDTPIRIDLKCPRCGMIVTVALEEKSVRRKPPTAAKLCRKKIYKKANRNNSIPSKCTVQQP